jgi:DNA-binding beta-propeller fold protein YncE
MALVLIAGCARAPRTAGERAPVRVPAALVVETEIKGSVLGTPLRQPRGLAVAFNGVVFLCDAGNSRIVRFDPSLSPSLETGGYGASDGLLDGPTFIAVDNDLNLVVSDPGNRRVCRFDARLNFADEIKLIDDEDPLKFGTPAGLALTEYGELWLADRERERVAIFDNVDRWDRFIGDFGYTGGQLSQPEKIVVDRKRQQFIVCDAGNSRLVVYDSYGNYERKIDGVGFDYPVAVAIDRDHGMWVLDGADGRLHFLSSDGTKLWETGPQLPGGEEALRNPTDIVILPENRLLVSDTGNDRLVVCRVVLQE